MLFTVVPLLLLEGGARLYIHFKYGKPGKQYGIWKYDKDLGATPRENAYNTSTETNNFAFRNKENVFEPKPEGSYRILVYGGSTAFCYNLTEEESWPSQLEQHLRAKHNPKDQVLNGGVITWSLGHAFKKAKNDIPPLKPDYVMIYSGINEYSNDYFMRQQGKIMKDILASGKHGEVATNLDQCGWAKRNLVLERLVEYVLTPMLEKRAEKTRDEIAKQKEAEAAEKFDNLYDGLEPDPAVLENYLLVLNDFFDLTEKYGGKPVFVIQAHGRNNKANVHFTSYSRKGAEFARKRGGVIVVDADEVVKNYQGEPMDLFIHSGAHFEKLGAKLLGEYLYQHMFEQEVPDSLSTTHLSEN